MPKETDRQRAHYFRVRWLFTLLYLGGLRISEVAENTMGSFFCRRDREGDERWWLEVLGKGDKERLVPATTESGLASSELLLKIAQVMCCTSIDFEEGGSVLSAQGQKALDALVPFFQEHLTAHLHLDSHTDNTGSPVAAKELSLARAQAARYYLVSKGVRPYQLSARGFGAEQPLQDNSTPDGRKRNRRIEFRL